MFNDANTSRNDLLHFGNLGTKVSERCSNDETYIKWSCIRRAQRTTDTQSTVNGSRHTVPTDNGRFRSAFGNFSSTTTSTALVQRVAPARQSLPSDPSTPTPPVPLPPPAKTVGRSLLRLLVDPVSAWLIAAKNSGQDTKQATTVRV